MTTEAVSPVDLALYRPLAVALLHDAAQKAAGVVRCSDEEQRECSEFLGTPTPLLALWCLLAGARMSAIVAATRLGRLTPPHPGSHVPDAFVDEARHVA